jgi:hypothetical protein
LSDDAYRIAQLDAHAWAIEIAMQEAVNEAILLHKRLGLPMVEWIDGKIVWTPADQLEIVDVESMRRSGILGGEVVYTDSNK